MCNGDDTEAEGGEYEIENGRSRRPSAHPAVMSGVVREAKEAGGTSVRA